MKSDNSNIELFISNLSFKSWLTLDYNEIYQINSLKMS